MILFLNKIDLFQAKLKFSSVSSYFPDFKGNLAHKSQSNALSGDDKDYLATSRFFQRKFIKLNKSSEKEVYAHFTNATGQSLSPSQLMVCRYHHSSKRYGFCAGYDHE